MRPAVICHMMSSVDGRLINERWTQPFDGKPQSALVAEYAKAGRTLDTDAWMFGLKTAQAFLPYKFVAKKRTSNMERKPFHANRTSERLFIVSDPEGTIFYNQSKVRGDDILTVLREAVPDDYLLHLQKAGISYIFAGKDGFDLPHALEILGNEFGIKAISLQGGGIINGAFLKAGLIDEISIAIYPGIDGLSGIPSIFESVGAQDDLPAQGQSLELKSVRQLADGVVWLRYVIHGNK